MVVVPHLSNMILSGIDFLSRQQAQINISTSIATVTFTGSRVINAILHPLRFEANGPQALLTTEKKLPAHRPSDPTYGDLPTVHGREISPPSR